MPLPPAPAPQVQTLTITTVGGFTGIHNGGDVVTQTGACAPNGVLASPGTVVSTLTYSNPLPKATVFPGENNSKATSLVLTEPVLSPVGPFLKKDSTFTYKIATAGVVFSQAPAVSATAGMLLSAPVVSADRTSATVTVKTASTGGAVITLSGILYDVASTVPGGTLISVGVTTSAALSVSPASRTNAIVFRGLLGVTATSPTVYIGENNQTAGLVSFTESVAGFFTDGSGSNNTFQICPSGVGYFFTVAPSAKVVGGTAAGNLILRDGAAASTTNIVKGTQNGTCYYWTVWTKSTTASTIQIGNADVSAGPVINVAVSQAPGGVNVELKIGSTAFDGTAAGIVQFATATYRNQVAVTALSQPAIAPGATNAAAGDLQVAETGLGQLKAGENICVDVLWRSGEVQDQFLNSLATNDLPIATASGGVVISPVAASQDRCYVPPTPGNGQPGSPGSGLPLNNPAVPRGYSQSFSFVVLQQSTTGTGKVVISNIKFTSLTDSAEGPVQLSVWGTGGTPTFVMFHSTVSNAIIGVKPTIKISALSALGVPPNQGPASTSTKVAAANKFITWRFAGGSALAGKTVRIYVSTRNSAGGYGPYVNLTGRVADANGNAFFSWRATKTWVSVRAYFAGDNSYAASWSNVTQGRWL